MKTIYRISLFFNLCCACFLLIKGTEFYYKNYVKMPEVKEEFRQSETSEENNKSADKVTVSASEKENTDESAAVIGMSKDITTCDTVFLVKEYDYSTGQTNSHEEKLPDLYIGKTREQLESLLADYNASPSLSDQEQGFEEITLDSFSRQMVIATRYYTSPSGEEDFYLMVEDDYITVYLGDLKTVYLYTGIHMSTLPENVQQEILDKKHIADKEELYNFLESYSS